MPIIFYKCKFIWYNKVTKGKGMNIDINDFVSGIIGRESKKLYLSFLYLLEDMNKNGKITDEEFQFARKRVLDYGNNCIRNIHEQLENFDFSFKDK